MGAEGAEEDEVVEGFEGAIGAEGDMGAEGAMGARRAMGAEWAEEDEGAAIYILLDGFDTIGIGYIALWGLGAKCGTGLDGLDGYPLDCYDY